MVFSSPIFLCWFLPLVLSAYWLVRDELKTAVLISLSLFFYSWGEPRALLVMLALLFVSYFAALAISKSLSQRRKHLILTLGIIINIGALVFYKYLGFLFENLNSLLNSFTNYGSIEYKKLVLPIGISFYVFELVSYLIDVSRGAVAPDRKLSTFIMYVSFFPRLIAGPILRYKTIELALPDRALRFDNVYRGLQRFIIGLGKKVLIADSLAVYADLTFQTPIAELPTMMAWIGALAYAFQIYYDFSGYSDMAIGLGRIFNFPFLENFRWPYSSKSVTEFWRRWHISLSSWFRDYLYVPLGGNRRGKLKTYRNLLIVFILCGMWHGASWTFIVWGAYNGVGLAVERFGLKKIIDRWPGWCANLYLLLFTIIGWVIFRSPNISYATEYLSLMFTGGGTPMSSFVTIIDFLSFTDCFIFIFAAIFSYPVLAKWRIKNRSNPYWLAWLFLILVLSYSFALTTGYSPNIYFRF